MVPNYTAKVAEARWREQLVYSCNAAVLDRDLNRWLVSCGSGIHSYSFIKVSL